MNLKLFFSASLISIFAFAAPPDLAALEKNTAQLEAQNKVVSEALVLAEKDASAAKKALDAAKKEYDSAKTAWETDAGGLWFGIGRGEGAAKRPAYEAAEKKLEAAKKSAAELIAKVDLMRLKSKALNSAIKNSKGDVEKASKALSVAIESMSLTGDFAKLQGQIGSIDVTLDKMNSAYDRAALGAYLKDKMGLLLNSNLFCEAKKRCDVPQPVKIDNKKIESALFPGTANSTRSQQYYDKVNPAPKAAAGTNQ